MTHAIVYDPAAPVPVTGDDCAFTLWRGRQWGVTEFGVERLDGRFAIPFSDLEAVRGKLFDWPERVAEQDGIDLEDFVTAFGIALAVAADPERQRVFLRTYQAARRAADRRARAREALA